MNAKTIALKSDSREGVDYPQIKQLSMKRLIFLSSLYFKLRGMKNPPKEELLEINKRFGLAHQESALRLPAAMSSILWGRTEAYQMFSDYLADDNQLSELAKRVVACCPEWARYDDPQVLCQDACAVFRYTKSKLGL